MNQPLWMPIWFDAGREVDGLWRSCTHYGAARADQREAWAEARRMCDETGGIGFTISAVEPVFAEGAATKAPRKFRRIQSDQQSLRGRS
ncbi:hypothetical protein PSP6_150033 [Paraburkholderia tropica]|uniref:hypothetical protein n=1 Tax=Paraburkholderia tropica TaxID=92647 RepID=UPI001CAE0405|nr:hypothetical protein [Paraburkholderia tropica]CAG9194525.1 hypothetical protein PSP6_150033 [Paraburkholderia tropica]